VDQNASYESSVLSFGPSFNAGSREEIIAATRAPELQIADRGHYDSAAGAVISAFLGMPTENRQLVYLNGDPRGHVYHAMVVNRM
jgi:hypothetical protein